MTRRGALVRSETVDHLSPAGWVDWMNGPQFGTPLYYGSFMERFPDRIEEVLDAIEQAPPGGVLFHCVAPELIADDYARAAERARTYDPVLDEHLAAKSTSARELVIELAASLDLDRPALRARLVA